MIYLWAALYLAAAAGTSFPAAAAIMQSGGYTSLSNLDREDWGLLVLGSLLWPVTWLASAWYLAARAYLRADTARRLRGLGADIEEDPDRG